MKLKLAMRSLLKNPFVMAVAVVSLALGIGANAAIFSIFHQILIRDLPVPEPGRLVNLSSPGPKDGGASCSDIGGCDSVFSYPMFRDLERQNVFAGIAAHVAFNANLAQGGQTESGRGLVVSGSYFPVLGLQPALGRLLGPVDDEKIDEPHAVVLGHDYWRRRFSEDPGVLNQTLTINGQPMTIVGVAPKGFQGTSVGFVPEVFVPITMMRYAWPGFNNFENRKQYWAYLFARLKPGTSMQQADAAINGPYHNILNDLEAPLQQMSPQTLTRFKAKQIKLDPGNRGQSQLQVEALTPLVLLLGVTAFVLLIACSNIANLLLARAATRTAEMAVRLSIGANRAQIVIQLLVESCLLAALGGVASLAVAHWTLALLESLVPAEVTMLHYELDTNVLTFTAALTIGTGILFGLFPALHSSRPDLMTALKGQSGQPSGARAAARFRTVLATAQIGLSMALLILSGLFIKSLFNVSRAKLGLNAENVVTFRVSPGLNGYPRQRIVDLFERIEDQVGTLPGVTGITSSTVPLLADDNWGTYVKVQGFQGGLDVDSESRYTFVGTNYFRTLGIPFFAGRDFTRADAEKTAKVAIVNEQFAKKFNLGRDAVGKRMTPGNGNVLDTEIIGLVPNSKYADVKEEVPPVFYRPYRQSEGLLFTNFYVRTSLDPDQLIKAISPVVARIDPNLPVQNPRTLPQQIRENVTVDRVISILSAVFAGVATILAAVGLYGVLAYTVAQRTREIGLRMALGAAPGRVRTMVLRQVGWMTIIGGTIGLVAALAAGRFAESLLFQLNGHDPIVLGVSIAVLVLIAFGAGFVPANRASSVDPIRALRYE
jgi:putative ABC transport system permease protein